MKEELILRSLLVIFILYFPIELFFSPRIGWTRNRDILLWYYYKGTRFYVKLFTL